MRQVQIAELTRFIGSLTGAADGGSLDPNQVRSDLDFFFEYDPAGADTMLGFDTTPPTAQQTLGDVGSDQTLRGKVAGNDAVGQHEDWSTAFLGGSEPGLSPEGQIEAWFDELEVLAVERFQGNAVQRPSGGPVDEVFVTADGRDLQQLIQKFLLGAVAYSQGTDDYLDDDEPGKGLLSPDERDGDAPYTSLEHQWDEGLGYFGAARNYGDYSDEEIAGKGGRDGWANGYNDADGDGAIDLGSEFNFGASTNAAKRDLGANVATDFTEQAFQAFLEGRAILAASDGDLGEEMRSRLLDARDRAVDAWERAIAATAVHYFNDTLQDMNAFGSGDYVFEDHAKHWSELKGFLLSLQFNPRAQISDTDLEEALILVGGAPVLATAEQSDIDMYATDLLQARSIVVNAYGFAPANAGDSFGEGGW